MGTLRTKLRRYHIWLGWVVGLPILFWVVSGLIMIIKPIDEVRGKALLAPPAPLSLSSPPVTPAVEQVGLSGLTLEQRAAGPRWVAKVTDGPGRIADPATGRWLPPLSAADAVHEVAARYTGKARVAAVNRTDADHPPLDLRQPLATWQVVMDDGTHFYVDSATGAIIATRTRFWRFYDWMWGLHIMDMTSREEPHNAWVAVFGIGSLVMAMLALVMLPLTIRRRRRKSKP